MLIPRATLEAGQDILAVSLAHMWRLGQPTAYSRIDRLCGPEQIALG